VKPEEKTNMPEVPDLDRKDLETLARVVELWEEIAAVLGRAELEPTEHALHIRWMDGTRYLGWVGCNENGDYTFQPCSDRPDAQE